MNEKHENHRRCHHCGGCVDYLCQDGATGETTHLETIRQLAEVTAERDEAVRELSSVDAEMQACYRRHGEVLRQLCDTQSERDALKRRVAQYLRVRDQPDTDLMVILRQEIEREEKGEWMPYHDWVTERRNAAERANEARAFAAERDALKRRVEALEREVETECIRRKKAIAERDREREISNALRWLARETPRS